MEWAWSGTFELLRKLFDSFGLDRRRSVSATFSWSVKQARLTLAIKRGVVSGVLRKTSLFSYSKLDTNEGTSLYSGFCQFKGPDARRIAVMLNRWAGSTVFRMQEVAMVRNVLAAVLSWVSSLSTRGTCAASCFPHQGMTLCSALGERFPRESGVFITLREH